MKGCFHKSLLNWNNTNVSAITDKHNFQIFSVCVWWWWGGGDIIFKFLVVVGGGGCEDNQGNFAPWGASARGFLYPRETSFPGGKINLYTGIIYC